MSRSGHQSGLGVVRAVEMLVDGVGDMAVGGGKSEGVLPQGRRRVAVPEASLGLEDLAPSHQEGRQAVAKWVQRCVVDTGIGTRADLNRRKPLR